MPKKYSNLDRTIKAEKAMAAGEARSKKARVSSKADPFKPKADAAKSAKARVRQEKRTAGPRVTGRFGVKETGAVPTAIRAGEWNQRSAEMRAKKRAKARKNPTGKAAVELKQKKGYSALVDTAISKNRKEAAAQRKRVTSAKPSGGPALSRVTSGNRGPRPALKRATSAVPGSGALRRPTSAVTKKAKAPAAKRGKRY